MGGRSPDDRERRMLVDTGHASLQAVIVKRGMRCPRRSSLDL